MSNTRVAWITTVQVLVDADSDADASDLISELLSEKPDVVDWSFLHLGGQYLLPTETIIDDSYEEGQVFK